MSEPRFGGDDLEIRAAWLYHVDGLTQAQVAARLHVSRPTVGRLLERARATGVVRVEIDAERLASFGMARTLQQMWSLREVVVVPTGGTNLSREARNERLSSAAAGYLRRYLHPGAVVGVAWGDTVQRTLTHLPAAMLEGVTLASLSGGIEHLTRRVLGQPALAGHLRVVPAPLLASSASVAQTLRNEPQVREVLELARTATVTLTGIGTALPGSSAARSGLITDTDVARFAAAGAVGDMLGDWFAADGATVSTDISNHRIGLGIEDLRDLPEVVGIAGGIAKIPAIRGALSGGYLDVLVTDEEVAGALVQTADVLADGTPSSLRRRKSDVA